MLAHMCCRAGQVSYGPGWLDPLKHGKVLCLVGFLLASFLDMRERCVPSSAGHMLRKLKEIQCHGVALPVLVGGASTRGSLLGLFRGNQYIAFATKFPEEYCRKRCKSVSLAHLLTDLAWRLRHFPYSLHFYSHRVPEGYLEDAGTTSQFL